MKYDEFREKTEHISEEKTEIQEKIAEIREKATVVGEVMTGDYDDAVTAAIAMVERALQEENESAEMENEALDQQKEELRGDILDAIQKNQEALDRLHAMSDSAYGSAISAAEQKTQERISQLQSLLEDLDSMDTQGNDSAAQLSGIVSGFKRILGISDNTPQSTADNPVPDVQITGSAQYKQLVKQFINRQVNYNPIQRSATARTEETIIKELAGGDMTEGSCSSLALAYAGNKAGYTVLDFRGGDSRDMFSSREVVNEIANLPGVQSTIIEGRDSLACANQLLNNVAEGKEYYLAAGGHAAIVRRKDTFYFEYLELQHPTSNGWKVLDDYVLANRFGCDASGPKMSNFLIDVDSLSNNTEFLSMLGYINTDGSKQVKGVAGYVR